MKCVNCGFEWTDGRGNHDCGAVKDAFYHWVVIERDKLRVENTELQLTIAELEAENKTLREDRARAHTVLRSDTAFTYEQIVLLRVLTEPP